VDGVQYIDQNSVNRELFDLKQIEVLKGPQGALYGRNAIGGAVVIQTKEPNFEEVEGTVSAGIGNVGTASGRAVISAPIVEDKIAFRAGYAYNSTDGHWRNEFTNAPVRKSREHSYMGQVMIRATENLDIDIKASRSEIRGTGINWNGMILGANTDNFSGDNVDLPWVYNIPGSSTTNRTNASIKIDYDIPDLFTITSVSAYEKSSDSYSGDSYPYFYDPTQFDTFFPGATPVGLGAQTQWLTRSSEVLHQDLRLTSPSEDRFRWIVGAYYADFDILNTSAVGADRQGFMNVPTPVPYGSGNQTLSLLWDDNNNEAYAFYGNFAFDVTDKLELNASIRYDKEKKKQTDLAFPGDPDPADPKAIPTWRIEAWRDRSASFSAWQPKFTVRYSATEDLSAYASWGKGFKTGGFNPFGTGELLRSFNPLSTVGDVFDKEVAETWEIGFKSKFWDNRVSFNAAAFMTDTKNAQLLEFFPQGGLQAISSADKVKMKGAEFDMTVAAADWLDLFLAAGFLDTEVKAFTGNDAAVGNKRPSTSPVTLNVGFTVDQPIDDTYTFIARADYRYQGKTYWDWVATPGAERSGFGLVNATAGVQTENWKVMLWSKNLFDKKYNAEHIVLLPGIGALWRAPERTFGVKFDYNF
jgi:iron complex outermembrane receptor protein